MQTRVGRDRGNCWLERNRAPRESTRPPTKLWNEPPFIVREMGGPLVKNWQASNRKRKLVSNVPEDKAKEMILNDI